MTKPSAFYPFLKGLVRFFYPKITVHGQENLPQEPCLVVGNHCQLNGPIACELYFPGQRYTWCAGEMMHKEEVAEYAFRDFWSQKPKWTHPFFKLVSHLIVPLAVCVFNSANTIAAYHDSRALATFKNTVARLTQGSSVVVFPEQDLRYNHIVYDFQDKFIDIARLYYKRTQKKLAFVPMYIAPKLKGMYLGKPIYFSPDADIVQERERIKSYLMEEITAMAQALPLHTVVPYRNIPKKLYPKNRQEVPNEKTCG